MSTQYLYTDSVPGNMHQAAITINRQERAQWLVALHPVSVSFCIAVYRVPLAIFTAMAKEDRRTSTSPTLN